MVVGSQQLAHTRGNVQVERGEVRTEGHCKIEDLDHDHPLRRIFAVEHGMSGLRSVVCGMRTEQDSGSSNGGQAQVHHRAQGRGTLDRMYYQRDVLVSSALYQLIAT